MWKPLLMAIAATALLGVLGGIGCSTPPVPPPKRIPGDQAEFRVINTERSSLAITLEGQTRVSFDVLAKETRTVQIPPGEYRVIGGYYTPVVKFAPGWRISCEAYKGMLCPLHGPKVLLLRFHYE